VGQSDAEINTNSDSGRSSFALKTCAMYYSKAVYSMTAGVEFIAENGGGAGVRIKKSKAAPRSV